MVQFVWGLLVGAGAMLLQEHEPFELKVLGGIFFAMAIVSIHFYKNPYALKLGKSND